MVNKVFHYAPGVYLKAIVSCGCLRPSNAGAPDEPALLWFSAHPHWEPTATKITYGPAGLRRLSFAEQFRTLGCIRFGLDAQDPRLLTWPEAARRAGMPRKTRIALEEVGRQLGANPQHWFATTCAVPLSELTLEILAKAPPSGPGGRWHLCDTAELSELLGGGPKLD